MLIRSVSTVIFRCSCRHSHELVPIIDYIGIVLMASEEENINDDPLPNRQLHGFITQYVAIQIPIIDVFPCYQMTIVFHTHTYTCFQRHTTLPLHLLLFLCEPCCQPFSHIFMDFKLHKVKGQSFL